MPLRLSIAMRQMHWCRFLSSVRHCFLCFLCTFIALVVGILRFPLANGYMKFLGFSTGMKVCDYHALIENAPVLWWIAGQQVFCHRKIRVCPLATQYPCRLRRGNIIRLKNSVPIRKLNGENKIYRPLVKPNVTKKKSTVAREVEAVANELPNSSHPNCRL